MPGRPQLGSPPDAGFGALSGKADSNEKKNKCVFIGSWVASSHGRLLAGLDTHTAHNRPDKAESFAAG